MRRLHPQLAIIVGAGISLEVVSMTDVTEVLPAIEQGDPGAAQQLLPPVCDAFRRPAGGC